jgi:hypothetical protein
MLAYYDRVLSDLKMDDETAKGKVQLVYLTLNGKFPSHYELFNERNVEPILIDYIQFIPQWLDQSLEEVNDSSIRDCIIQYKQLLFTITNNFQLTVELKELISSKIEESWSVLNAAEPASEILRNQFIHIKWHTVHEFFTNLGNQFGTILGVDINFPVDESITKTTHRNSKKSIVLSFTYEDNFIYIANDKKGFTWGGSQVDWKNFDFENSNQIRFCEFDNLETFSMINQEYSNKIISSIMNEILAWLNHNKE